MSESESSLERRGLSKTVCFLCRQRKIRCNRRIPKCDSCSKAHVECRYIQVKKKPGLRAGYVSELEARLERLEREVQEMKAEWSSASILPGLPSPEGSLHTLNESTPERVASLAPRSVRSSSATFDPLASTVVKHLCAVWFETYHTWFPILHQPTLLEVLETCPNLAETTQYIVLKAIVSVTLPHSYPSDSLTNEQRQDCSENLRNEVLMNAIGQLSLQSLQGILILSIRDYGTGRLSEFWNLIALAKRMGTQLGLRDLVANFCDNFNQPSTIPPRMLPLPDTLVKKEERIRAYWMIEVLDGSSSLGAAWNLSISRPEYAGLLPCSDTIWPYPEAFISLWSFGESEISSTYSLYAMLVTRELWHVHCFLQKSFDTQSATERLRWQAECRTVDERLTQWRAKFDEASMRLSVESGNLYDPNAILTQCFLDLATISLYQRLALPPAGLEEAEGPWLHAIQRCLNACDDITCILRVMQDTNLESMNPLIISSIFVASRFYVVHARLVNVEIPRNLDLLLYSLKTCGLRWPLARRLEKVIRTATGEHKLPSPMLSLPIQFYDLQYSYYDIDESIRVWAGGLEPWMHLSGLEDPAFGQASIALSHVRDGSSDTQPTPSDTPRAAPT